MSNNNKHNYSKYSVKKAPEQGTVEPETKVPEVVESVPEVEVPEIKLVEETVETVTLPETVNGFVTNCNKLNVRMKPNANAAVVRVIDVGTKITINLPKSVDGWYYIRINNGTEGYCMKQFVNARI